MEGNYMFDFFKRQRPKQTDPSSDLAKVVERMFLEYGVTHIPVGNVFLTVIDGVHCSFQTIIFGNNGTPISVTMIQHYKGIDLFNRSNSLFAGL